MATATITWVPVNGSNYEIWYAKLSVVGSTSTPSSIGWTQATGSPFDSSLGIATINGLDDSTQYIFASRNDCTSSDSPWQTNIKYKLVCPAFSPVANPVSPTDAGASISTIVNLLNLVEFEAIASSVTLTFKKTSDSSVADTKVFNSPYASSTLTYTSSSLLVTTGYTIYLSVHDGIANTDIACSNQSISTQTPAAIPPPVCTAPTFTISNVATTSLDITITSTLLTGDTFDVSIDGGISYVSIGNSTSPVTISGLLSGTIYQVVVRRNCVGGGQGISTSQTITTLTPTITGTISLNAPSSSGQSTTYVVVTFPQPTPVPLTLYLGYTWQNHCSCLSGSCTWSNGYDIFPQVQSCPPSGSGGPNAADTQGDPYSGPPHLPFVVNVPQGVTTFTANNIYTTLGNPGPNGGVLGSWQTVFLRSSDRYTDLYVHIQNPVGYTGSFTMANGQNITGVIIHNV